MNLIRLMYGFTVKTNNMLQLEVRGGNQQQIDVVRAFGVQHIQ